MTQEAIELRTTGDTYPGVAVIQGVNKALQTIATDFAGAADPGSLADAWMTWADTGNMLLKRRNAANSEWVVEATLLKASLPQYAEADIPTTNRGDIHVIGKGAYSWAGAAYAPANLKVSSLESIGPIKAAPSTAGNEVVVQSQVFGIGQTWQDLTSSRSMGVGYVNSTSKPIEVVVRIINNNGNILTQYYGATILSEGVAVSSNTAVAGTPGVVLEVRATIPPGSSYEATISTNVSASLQYWAELR